LGSDLNSKLGNDQEVVQPEVRSEGIKTMKQTLGHWIPAAFCAFISLIALFASSGPDAGWWRPTFFAFLPMCFFFVGTATSQMQREIRELRKQVVELQAKRVA
jgi:hypothetical protein